MIPIGDENPSPYRGVPWVTVTLIVLNVLVFLFELTQGDAFIAGFGAIPYELIHNVDLVGYTGDLPQAPGPVPIYLTLLTSMFVHGGWLHLIGNMVYLWIFGDNVEFSMGHFRFIVFYLLCGVLASVAHIVASWDSTVPSVGASGAIAGVLGAYIVLYPSASVRTLLILGPFITMTRLPALVLIGFWFFTQFLSGLVSIGDTAQTSGVAFWAHIGGFVAGVVLIFLFRKRASYTYART
jgi:membrane associated rhomboid family serine protease